MPVIVDGKKLIPAPFVNISEEFAANEAGKVIKKTFAITLSGTLLPDRGSPNSNGVFWTDSGYPENEVVTENGYLDALLRKQEALRKLFRNGILVEITPLNGGMPLKFNPRVKRIAFPADNWVTDCEYTIELEADQLSLTGDADGSEFTSFITNASNEWTIDITNEDQGVYRLTHSLSASGIESYQENGQVYRQAWENAKKYVLETLGLGLKTERMKAPDVLDANSIKGYNYLRSNSVNEENGTFAVTESWTCFDPGDEPPAIEDWNVSVRENIEDGLSQISIEGSVTGLEVRNNTTRELVSRKYTNAKAKFTDYVKPALPARIQSVTGLTINPSPLSSVVGHNDISGVITYSFDYNDRPGTTIPGAIRESIRISGENQIDVYASHVIPGKTSGPLYQSIGTKTGRALSVALEAKFAPRKYGQPAISQPDVTSTILAYKPSTSGTIFISSDTYDWDPTTGNYSRRVTWTW